MGSRPHSLADFVNPPNQQVLYRWSTRRGGHQSYRRASGLPSGQPDAHPDLYSCPGVSSRNSGVSKHDFMQVFAGFPKRIRKVCFCWSKRGGFSKVSFCWASSCWEGTCSKQYLRLSWQTHPKTHCCQLTSVRAGVRHGMIIL